MSDFERYKVTAFQMNKSKLTYNAALIAPIGGLKAILIRAWASPAFGMKCSAWIDTPWNSMKKYEEVCVERAAADYKVVSSQSNQPMSLGGIARSQQLAWLFSDLSPVSKTKLLSVFKGEELRYDAADQDLSGMTSLLDRFEGRIEQPPPPVGSSMRSTSDMAAMAIIAPWPAERAVIEDGFGAWG